jgi:hypothetical protein
MVESGVECSVGFYGCILGYILSCILGVESEVAFWGRK